MEDSIRFSLDCYYKEDVGNRRKYRLMDVDGKEITPNELAEKYFSSPEDCFIKADETLRAEERAPISNNILYSQDIRHKIIPPTCNNIRSEFPNNRIEVIGPDKGIDEPHAIASDGTTHSVCGVTHAIQVSPFQCTYCDQSFTNKIELIAHMDRESATAIAEYERKRTES